MQIDEVQHADVEGWVSEYLRADDLLGGRVPTLSVDWGRIGGRGQILGTQRLDHSLESLDLADVDDIAAYLDRVRHDFDAGRSEVARLILNDAEQVGPITHATSLISVLAAAPGSPIGVVVSPGREQDLFAGLPTQWAKRTTTALDWNNALFVLPARDSVYCIEVNVSVVRDGPRSTLAVAATAARISGALQRPQVSHLQLI